MSPPHSCSQILGATLTNGRHCGRWLYLTGSPTVPSLARHLSSSVIWQPSPLLWCTFHWEAVLWRTQWREGHSTGGHSSSSVIWQGPLTAVYPLPYLTAASNTTQLSHMTRPPIIDSRFCANLEPFFLQVLNDLLNSPPSTLFGFSLGKKQFFSAPLKGRKTNFELKLGFCPKRLDPPPPTLPESWDSEKRKKKIFLFCIISYFKHFFHEKTHFFGEKG